MISGRWKGGAAKINCQKLDRRKSMAVATRTDLGVGASVDVQKRFVAKAHISRFPIGSLVVLHRSLASYVLEDPWWFCCSVCTLASFRSFESILYIVRRYLQTVLKFAAKYGCY